MRMLKNRGMRLLGIALGLVGLFGLLIVKFYQIQVIQHEKWMQVANRQHFFTVKEPFMRGKFYSNNTLKKGHIEPPQPFVIDIEKFHLFVDPESLPENKKDEISKNLIAMLDVTVEERINFRKQFFKKSRSRKLTMWLDKDSHDNVIKWWIPYAKKNKIPKNALFFQTDYQRSYPYGAMLGQVLHTVQGQKDELTKQALPTGGLELYFNNYLQGKLGKRRLMRSPRNSLETGEIISKPEDGADIYLTINQYLQAIAEEELMKGVKKSNAKGGWAVMMDPRTGEILALAQYPFFDPSEYTNYFNDPIMIDYTRVRAATDAIEPGSVMKTFTITIAFLANEELKKRGESPLFDPEEKIDTSNGNFPGRSKPLTDTKFHHYCNLLMGVQKSSNRYMARLTERVIKRLGAEWYRNALNNIFGFGEKTGIELQSESRGMLPVIGKYHPNGTPEWSKATPYSLAIGYNIQVNSFQLLRAYSILLNGGNFVQPTLVRKIVKKDPEGKEVVVLDNTNHQHLPHVLPAEIGEKVVPILKYTTKTGGSATKADIWGYTEAGKTGTAEKLTGGQYGGKRRICTFIGFTPVKDPAFILLITIDEPEYGYIPGVGHGHRAGVCAAPIFKEIARRSLEYLGVAPDDPFGYPAGDPRCDPNKADWVMESRRLQEMYQKWNNSAYSGEE